MKLERKALAHYLNSEFGGTASGASWFLLGADMEELSVELNPDMEPFKNILGQSRVRDNGYEPQTTADPYYANPEDSIYEPIRDIAMERKTGDACKTQILEVIIEDTKATSHPAYIEDVIVKPTSYGGDTTGITIPFDIYFCGNRKKGTVKLEAGVPTFTEASAPV